MKKRIIWLVMSCLMVAALVLASCGPAEEEEEERDIKRLHIGARSARAGY